MRRYAKYVFREIESQFPIVVQLQCEAIRRFSNYVHSPKHNNNFVDTFCVDYTELSLKSEMHWNIRSVLNIRSYLQSRIKMRESIAKIDEMERQTSIANKGYNLMRKFRDPESGEFRQLSAQEFLDCWKHYDTDGNGFIDGPELDKFLLDIMTSLTASKDTEIVSTKLFVEFKETFLKAYDDNNNQKIEIKELVHILPIEQPLRDLLLHHSSLKTSVDFMKIWKKYDSDNSGYIESDELKCILEDFYKSITKSKISANKLDEYTNLIFEIFDSNRDGKLQLSEVSRMLPVEENIFKQMKLLGRVSNKKINQIFDKYDLDKNGYIDSEELQIFLKDLLDVKQSDYDMNTVEELKNTILNSCDFNSDNQLEKKELKAVLKSISIQNGSRKCLTCNCIRRKP